MPHVPEFRSMLSRRRLLSAGAGGLGLCALNSLARAGNGLTEVPHFPSKAKRVIYLFQSGGPSQIDLFDFKPAMRKLHASELPDFYPIPQHCEMSFCANPPRRVFFCCLVEPAEGSGETPLCDFRKVWNDLDPDVRARFVDAGLRHVRNYSGPGVVDDDPVRLKPWPDMFLTTDPAEVEAKCREEGFEPSWLPNQKTRWPTGGSRMIGNVFGVNI